ncbi:MAG: hypothetical protein HXY44_01545 [Syntrophaceae bacterium]|nr:hypothetical protein [Syntrophaceae bacterium]
MALRNTSQEGLKEGWTRATFIIRTEYLEKLKTCAYWERKKIKETIDEALRLFLKEKKNRKKTNKRHINN